MAKPQRWLLRAVRLSLLAVLSWCVLAGTALAQTQEVIEHFNSQVAVTKDGQLDVEEKIDMNFADDQRHGIFRTIPVKFDTAHGTKETALRLVSVAMDDKAVPYQIARQFNDINIKIGDPKYRVSGRHTYLIHYMVSRAVNFFDDQPEIYWNATGNEWPFPIQDATAQFILPSGVDARQVRATCFRGSQGSKDEGTFTVRDGQIDFSTQGLAAAEGLTFVLRLPPGSVTVTSNVNELLWWLQEWWPAIVIPGATLLWVFFNWNLHGKDPGNAQVAGVDWNPPKELSPAEVGTLIDERCDVADIVSTLVDLAVRGYLRIEQQKTTVFFFSSTDYQFTKLDPPANAPPLKAHEAQFLAGLFATRSQVTLSSLKYDFYTYIPTLRNSIYNALTENGYFVSNPETCRYHYLVLGAVIGAAGLLVGFASPPTCYGLMISAVSIMCSSPFMPKRTKKGVDACRESVGFKRFVQKAEKERIRVLAANDPTIFGRLLPYAMVLGAADRWAEAFHDLILQPPDWYVPYGMNGAGYRFSSISFVNDLGDGMRTCASTFTATPPSSSSSWSSGDSGAAGGFSGFDGGGGFSGGGFGGGGGGSW